LRLQQASELEIRRLRAQARIDYFNQRHLAAASAPAGAPSNYKEKQ
jgi:hypothetical protein